VTWQDVAVQLELDAAAYEAIVADPDAPLPPPWSPALVAGPPPAALHHRLTVALARLHAASGALALAKARKADELAGLGRPGELVSRYLDTTA
jgi:hypothetical protein